MHILLSAIIEQPSESFGQLWFYTYTYRVSSITCPFVAKSVSKLRINSTTTQQWLGLHVLSHVKLCHKMTISQK